MRRGFEAREVAGEAEQRLKHASGNLLMKFAAEAVAAALGVDHTLCSRIEVKDGRFTGRLEQPCFGAHKVRVAERFADEHGVRLEDSVFYSDSYNDLPMLERVGTAVAINPDARLRRHALRSGWRIERWA